MSTRLVRIYATTSHVVVLHLITGNTQWRSRGRGGKYFTGMTTVDLAKQAWYQWPE